MRFERVVPALLVSSAIVAAAIGVSAVILRSTARLESTIRSAASDVQSTAAAQARFELAAERMEETSKLLKERVEIDSWTDIGPTLAKTDRECGWFPDVLPLGETGFSATAGPLRYLEDGTEDPPDWYRIEVTAPSRTGGQRVWFSREFAVRDLPPRTLGRPIEELVSYDRTARTVTFALGDSAETYRLPPR